MTGMWAVSATAGALSERPGLLIPFAGPILTAIDLNHEHDRSSALGLATGLLIADALLQGAGLVLAIVGGASRGARRPTAPAASFHGAGVGVRF